MRLILCLVSVLVFSGATRGATLFDDFNSYADQAAFQAAWPSFASNSTSMSLFTSYGWPSTAPTPGQQCVRRPTGPGVGNTNFNYHLLPQVSKPTANVPITFEYDLYDSGGDTQTNREFCTLRAYSGGSPNTPWFPADATDTSSLVSQIFIGTGNVPNAPYWSGRIYSAGSQLTDGMTFQAPNINNGVPTSSTLFFNLNTPRPGMPGSTKSSGWTHLKVVISPAAVDFYVDGALDTHVVVTNGDKWVGFDGVTLGSGLSTNATMLIDNISVVPEPITLALLCCGSLLLRQRRVVKR